MRACAPSLQAFAALFQSKVHNAYRIVHNRDPVPHVPLKLMGFQHSTTEVFYEEDYAGPSSLRVCGASGTCAAGLGHAFTG